jgi:hypothetical protein
MNAPTHAAYSQTLGIQARAASTLMARASAATRSACLRRLAQLLRDNTAPLQAENQKDLARATAAGLAAPMVDRLKLTPRILDTVAEGCEQIAVERFARRLNRQRSGFREFGSHFLRDLPYLILRHQPVGQSQFKGFFAGNAFAGQEQPFRGLMTDETRQRNRHAEAGVITHCAEVRRETRFLAGHAEIRDQRESESGTDGAAVNRGNNRFARLHQALRFVIEVPRLGNLLFTGRFVINALFQVGAGAEMFAGGGEHDAAAVAVLVQRFKRRGQFTNQVDIQKIVGRTAQFHCCDMSVEADADFLFSHGLFR